MVLVIAWATGWVVPAAALSSDRTQPINIKADRVHIEEKTGISDYDGNVEMTQGSIVVTGDHVRVYQVAGRVQKVVASGAPAHFRQRPDHGAEVIADAEHMEYLTENERLILTGNAHVVQGGNSFAGHLIEYDTRQSVVNASKGEQGEGRVRATIVPGGSPQQKQP